MHIHDELVFELPQNRLKEAIFYIKNCMETKPFEEFLISIVAETAHGKHFGELEKFDGYEE
jgi:DNA polymerase-1